VADSAGSQKSVPPLLGRRDSVKTLRPRHIAISRWIVDSRAFIVTTTLLTIYALIGDDIRLMATEQPDDDIFAAITITCMAVFTVEIILSSLGKDDYFLGFFFWLDIVSTISLVMDLQAAQDWLSELTSGEDGEVDNARASRTAKIGARLGRILRLVRIIKLYKVAYDARQRKKSREAREARAEPGDDDDWLDEVDEDGLELQPESRVGKKLSELTTRRVIVLVLVMMFVIPWLRIDQAAQLPFSAYYGADLVHEAFSKMIAENETSSSRKRYEEALLQYVYYHNWYTGHSSSCPYDGDNCPKNYDSHLFWIGVVAKDQSLLAERIRQASLQNSSVVEEWEYEHVTSQQLMYNFGPMPDTVKTSILGERWDLQCPPSSSNALYRTGMSVLLEEVDDFNGASVSYAVRCPENLRSQERQEYYPRLNVLKDEFQESHFVFFFDLRPYVFWDAFFSLMITVFVILALLLAAMLFTNDANHLVLNPVESMISKVEAIRHDPMMARRMADKEFNLEEKAKARKTYRQVRTRASRVAPLYALYYDKLGCWPKVNASELMETVVLEKTIIKLGTLLALGFGEAGAAIIEHNMHGIDSASVNAMVEGTKVECVIGVARIRDFSTVTEVLQAKVMTFVNQIAEIVHGVVDEFHGAANRNNGDVFLMIWRMEDESSISKMADMSVLAFAKILGSVHRSPVLAVYRGHPGLQQRLPGKSCRVNLSCGLHFGWAIEGAVGSEFKIDASYLSPNVSIAESVERATQIYGVSILLTEFVKNSCTPEIANKFRLIDCVKISGSKEPMELYVMDLWYCQLKVDHNPLVPTNWSAKQRYNVRQFMYTEKERKLKADVHMGKYFMDNMDISEMRHRYTEAFFLVFNMGYQNYAQGEWKVAHRLLNRTRTMLGPLPEDEDGVSSALLKYMEANSTPPSNKGEELEAPPNWKGVRELRLGRGGAQ
jgi:class 3 adenylate cyclase